MFVQVHACRLYRPDRSVRVEALAGGDTGDYGTGRDDTGDYGTGRDGTGGSVRHTPVAPRTPRGEHALLCLDLSVNIL